MFVKARSRPGPVQPPNHFLAKLVPTPNLTIFDDDNDDQRICPQPGGTCPCNCYKKTSTSPWTKGRILDPVIELTDSEDDEDAELPMRFAPKPSLGNVNTVASRSGHIIPTQWIKGASQKALPHTLAKATPRLLADLDDLLAGPVAANAVMPPAAPPPPAAPAVQYSRPQLSSSRRRTPVPPPAPVQPIARVAPRHTTCCRSNSRSRSVSRAYSRRSNPAQHQPPAQPAPAPAPVAADAAAVAADSEASITPRVLAHVRDVLPDIERAYLKRCVHTFMPRHGAETRRCVPSTTASLTFASSYIITALTRYPRVLG
ncbi:hypothetical protein BJ912DRAFT_1145177 [Pholiota molesta]|nr:hypothetical protein BJ912DRAFT_1145177 [Pholiota molesta]